MRRKVGGGSPYRKPHMLLLVVEDHDEGDNGDDYDEPWIRTVTENQLQA